MTDAPETYLLDTNVLLRLTDRSDPAHPTAIEAVKILTARGDLLFITPQNLIEFWNVATRPADKNGLGLLVEQSLTEIQKHETAFRLLPDSEKIFSKWKDLVKILGVQGIKAHDTRLAAVAISSDISYILTFNVKDFRRFESAGLKVIEPSTIVLTSKIIRPAKSLHEN